MWIHFIIFLSQYYTCMKTFIDSDDQEECEKRNAMSKRKHVENIKTKKLYWFKFWLLTVENLY
jgi:hypothetical protein